MNIAGEADASARMQDAQRLHGAKVSQSLEWYAKHIAVRHSHKCILLSINIKVHRVLLHLLGVFVCYFATAILLPLLKQGLYYTHFGNVGEWTFSQMQTLQKLHYSMRSVCPAHTVVDDDNSEISPRPYSIK